MEQFNNLDGVSFLKGLGKESVDLILTDPPYNISRDNNFKTMGRSGIDFGEWDKGFDTLSWFNAAYSILKKGGSLVFFNDWKNIGEMAKYAESVGFEIKDMIRWEKSNPMPRNRDRRYVTDYEMAVWLAKPKGKWTFNRISDTYDRPLLQYVRPNRRHRIHPTQKPVALLEELFKRNSNEGDLVVDPFAGSCSLAIACTLQNREFLVNDLDTDMLLKGKEWHKNVTEGLQHK